LQKVASLLDWHFSLEPIVLHTILSTVVVCWLALGAIGMLFISSINWKGTGQMVTEHPFKFLDSVILMLAFGPMTFAYGVFFAMLMSFFRGWK
jgi:hypothetical protein